MAIAYVQGRIATPGGSGTTVVLAFNSNVTAGNLIVVSAGWGNTDGTPTCADSLGNTYAAMDKLWNATNSQGHCTFYAKNISGGACTVTVTLPGSVGSRMIVIDEYSGADTSAPLDQHTIQVQDNPGTGTDAVTSGNVTTGVNNELIYGSTQAISGNAAITAGTGFTSREYATNTLMSEDKLLATAGTTAATFTIATNRRMITAVATFKPSSGGTTHEASATLAGTGTLTAIGAYIRAGLATLAGAGTISAAGALLLLGAATLTGTATVTAAGSTGTTHEASATLTGTGTLTGAALITRSGSATLAGTATLEGEAEITRPGSATLTGTAILTAAGTVGGLQEGAATLQGTATLAATSAVDRPGAAGLTGTATLEAASSVTHPAVVTLTGTGTVEAYGSLDQEIHFGAATLAGTATLTALGAIARPVGMFGLIPCDLSGGTYPIVFVSIDRIIVTLPEMKEIAVS